MAMEIKVTRKDWMRNPDKRWNAGLEKAGFNFRQGLQRDHYPPLPPKGHRTYMTADKAGFRITEEGRVMEFGSTHYLRYILYGTSKWEGWPGKQAELKEVMIDGFKAGVRDYDE